MITQNDHGKLAGLFAAHWGNRQFERPRPLVAMLRAAQYHDTGWLRYETDPILDPATGRSPSYFQVPNDATQLAAYQQAIDMLTEVDRYSGLMASKHRTGLWQHRYGAVTQPPPGPPRSLSDDIRAFIATNEARQRDLASDLDHREVAVNYNLLQVWDLLSLYICSRDRPDNHTIGPAPTGYATPAGVMLTLRPASAAAIVVEPFPFDTASLEAAIVYRQLPSSSLRDADAFKAAYFGAPPQVAFFTFTPA